MALITTKDVIKRMRVIGIRTRQNFNAKYGPFIPVAMKRGVRNYYDSDDINDFIECVQAGGDWKTLLVHKKYDNYKNQAYLIDELIEQPKPDSDSKDEVLQYFINRCNELERLLQDERTRNHQLIREMEQLKLQIRDFKHRNQQIVKLASDE